MDGVCCIKIGKRTFSAHPVLCAAAITIAQTCVSAMLLFECMYSKQKGVCSMCSVKLFNNNSIGRYVFNIILSTFFVVSFVATKLQPSSKITQKIILWYNACKLLFDIII